MTEDELNRLDDLGLLWSKLASRAGDRCGVRAHASMNGLFNYETPRISLEASFDRFPPSHNPLLLVARFEEWVRELRREVIMAMATGKFDCRPTREEMAECATNQEP